MPLHVSARPGAPTGRARARHAAPGPASTPLTGLTAAVAARAGTAARRGAVVAASTGLVMALGVTASSAEPLVEEPRPAPALTAPAPSETPEHLEETAPAVTEALTVAADVPVTFARAAAPAVTPPPPPPPPPAPVVEEPADEEAEEALSERDDAGALSRSGERSGSDGSSSEDSEDGDPDEGAEDSGADDGSSDDGSSDDGGSDEGGSDEGGSDEGGSEDGGSEDSGSEDSGSEDSGSEDSGSDDAPSSSAGGSVLDIAAQYVGTPYSYGGTSPSGFDCSGFTQYVFAQAGISLPRTAAAQGAAGERVSRSEARPGDLAVVSDGSHVGIYAGGNQWYDSPRPGKSVSLRDIWTSDVYFVRY